MFISHSYIFFGLPVEVIFEAPFLKVILLKSYFYILSPFSFYDSINGSRFIEGLCSVHVPRIMGMNTGEYKYKIWTLYECPCSWSDDKADLYWETSLNPNIQVSTKSKRLKISSSENDNPCAFGTDILCMIMGKESRDPENIAAMRLPNMWT